MSGIIRNLGLDGPPAHLPAERVGRKIERADVDFALANRGRMGWQTIANIRGIHQGDLRRECERVLNPQPPAAAGAARPKITVPLRVLALIAGGCKGPSEVAFQLGMVDVDVQTVLRRLKAYGQLTGTARRAGGWIITAPGRAALKAAGLADG